jgi:outer membrane protein TolC
MLLDAQRTLYSAQRALITLKLSRQTKSGDAVQGTWRHE